MKGYFQVGTIGVFPRGSKVAEPKVTQSAASKNW